MYLCDAVCVPVSLRHCTVSCSNVCVCVFDVCYRTALAEAEIEYNDSYCSPSVYIKYRLQQMSDALANLGNVTYIEPRRHFLVNLRLCIQ